MRSAWPVRIVEIGDPEWDERSVGFERGVYVKEREEKSEGGHGAKRVTT